MVLPKKRPGRERWLTRSHAAELIWRAWRYREVQKGHATEGRSRAHVAHFILVVLYTDTRAGAVCAAAFEPLEGYGYVDVDRGLLPPARWSCRDEETPAGPFLGGFWRTCGAGNGLGNMSIT